MAKAKSMGVQGADWMPETCKRADLVKIFGVSPRTIATYSQTGLLVDADKKNHYKTLDTIHSVLDHFRKEAAGRGTSTGDSLANERAKTEKVKRELAEMDLAKAKGEVLTLDEVKTSWSGFARWIKSSVLSIPSKARAAIPHLTAHDAEILRDICREILEDAATEVEEAVIGVEDNFNTGETDGKS